MSIFPKSFIYKHAYAESIPTRRFGHFLREREYKGSGNFDQCKIHINTPGVNEDIFNDALYLYNPPGDEYYSHSRSLFRKKLYYYDINLGPDGNEDYVIRLLKRRLILKLRKELTEWRFMSHKDRACDHFWLMKLYDDDIDYHLALTKEKLRDSEVQKRLREDHVLINKLSTPKYSHLIEDKKFNFIRRIKRNNSKVEASGDNGDAKGPDPEREPAEKAQAEENRDAEIRAHWGHDEGQYHGVGEYMGGRGPGSRSTRRRKQNARKSRRRKN